MDETSYDQPQPNATDSHVVVANFFEAADLQLFARDVLLEGLRQTYVLESRADAEQMLRFRPTAISLLSEATAHLDEAFGPECVKAIRVVHDDFGTSIFGIVFWPDSAERSRQALARFDREWWLQNCNRGGGVVNFNVELV